MTEQEYFGRLEMRISRELAGMREEHLHGMWCDGFLPEKFVVTGSGSHVAGRVWMANGHGNQSLWNFVLLLGRTRVPRADVDWSAYVPAEATTGWLYLDFGRRFLKVKLSAARPERTSAATEPAAALDRPGSRGKLVLRGDATLRSVRLAATSDNQTLQWTGTAEGSL